MSKFSKFDDIDHKEGVWRKADDDRLPENLHQPPKAITITNESCWHEREMIPNPPESKEHQMVDEHYKKVASKDINKTKIIMAHEFQEDPDSYTAVRQQVADSYNNAHMLTVGKKPPIDIEEK